MSAKQQPDVTANPVKEPEQWVTGNEPMTGPQRSYLGTLAREAGEEVKEELTKAEASEKIEELQEKTSRGAPRGRKASTAKRAPRRSAGR